MKKPVDILKDFWGYDSFRHPQDQVIASILEGRDTLALLPTGGGKSICFQVPALIQEGICIVISPLISLMEDQVNQLKSRGINAIAIHSGLRKRQVDILLDNCIYGDVKLLYLSPERIQTEIFQERLKRMNVNLLAIDEAHCISQWGHDFRPSYLQIGELRALIPNVPCLALTASAPPLVQEEIRKLLSFSPKAKTFTKAFLRSNLSFKVFKSERKWKYLSQALNASQKSSVIIYMRSRKKVEQLSQFLNQHGIQTEFYHAGLSYIERKQKQEQWMTGKSPVMVATNAFGMGIDKENVKLVIHFDLPENMESYYQEAGRAGRDLNPAQALMLYEAADLIRLRERVELANPSVEAIERVYNSICNYLQLAQGSFPEKPFDFKVHHFAKQFKLSFVQVYQSLRKLEKAGLLMMNEGFFLPSRLYVLISNSALYQFQIANVQFEPLIKVLVRIYGGELFSGFTIISESKMATLLKSSVQMVRSQLLELEKRSLISYQVQMEENQLFFLCERVGEKHLQEVLRPIAARSKIEVQKMEQLIAFMENSRVCRQTQLSAYFGEEGATSCGICDNCKDIHVPSLERRIIDLLTTKPMNIELLLGSFQLGEHKVVLDILRELVEKRMVKLSPDQFFSLE